MSAPKNSFETIYNGNYKDKQVLKDGKLHSVNGEPAVVKYERTQFVETESESEDEYGYGYQGTKHWLSYVTLAEWYQNGKLHRENGPAHTEYIVPNDSLATKCCLTLEEWYQNGELHREDGPARTEYTPKYYYYEESNLILEEWYKNGKRHREDGPAYIEYYRDGVISEKKWYIEGKLVRFYDYFDSRNLDEDDNIYYISYSTIWYNENGEKHREDGPADIFILKKYSKVDDTIISVDNYEIWYRNGISYDEKMETN